MQRIRHRRFSPAGVLLLGLALLPASASPAQAGTTQLEPPLSELTPGRIVISRTTGFQVISDGRTNPFVIPHGGRLVAYTLKLAKARSFSPVTFNQLSNRFGGEPQARISVLRPTHPRTAGSEPMYTLAGQSPTVRLQPHFGRTVTFRLRRPLLVRKGWIVGLSTPTWAPVLSMCYCRRRFAWRTARIPPCQRRQTWQEEQSAHTQLGTTQRYACLYRGGALAYRATIKYRS